GLGWAGAGQRRWAMRESVKQSRFAFSRNPAPQPRSLSMITSGSCHCGNLSFALDWREAAPRIAARSCTCSFCRKHGGTWTSCPSGALEITVKDPARVGTYAFGTGTAQFHVCATCGVVPVVTSEVDGRLYGVVNVNAFDGVDASLIDPPTAGSFDGESTDERLARRKRNWIPDVVFRHVSSA
ncbi:hypothetical protein U0E23_35335, partial [Burkholderia stagnalis]